MRKLTPEQAAAMGKLGGRKRGSKNQATKDREAALSDYRERVRHLTGNLLNYQLTLARGQTFLYKIEINPKTKQKSRPILIEDQETIEAYLNHELDNESDEYYYLTTKEPNTNTIDSMLDRTYGKSVAITQVQGSDGGPLEVTVINYGTDNTTLPVQP